MSDDQQKKSVSSPEDIFPPDFVRPEMVEEDTENHLRRITFPGGFSCYTQSEPAEAALIYNEIMVKQEYFQSGLSVVDARCVIDIGANIGIFTMAMKMKAPEAAIYAFEPIPDTFKALEQNVRSLGYSDVHLFNLAIGSQDHSEKIFTYYPHMPGNSTALPTLKEIRRPVMDQIFGQEYSDFLHQSETRSVQVRTLSSVIREQGITTVDYLKIDVEGNEVSVLEGIEEMHWPIIKQVAIEAHNAELQEQVSTILSQHGLSVLTGMGLSSGGGTSMVYAHRA